MEWNLLTVRRLCELTGVSRSGYYRWLAAKECRKAKEEKDRMDFSLIAEACRFRGYSKGVRGIYMRLLHMGIRMNHKKIRRLMKKYGLFCPVRKANPYRQMMRAMRTNKIADNLVKREFREHGPRKILLTDITYIPFQEGFVYLSVITDAYTKQVLAYRLSRSLEVDFVLETVYSLIRAHGISLNQKTYIHSDQGSHYTSIRFQELIRDQGLIQSMSRKGNCWDNSPQESLFGHMKDEIGKGIRNQSYEEIQTIIDDWMDYYNNDRYQWNLARLSPNEYYEYIKTGVYPLSEVLKDDSMSGQKNGRKDFQSCP